MAKYSFEVSFAEHAANWIVERDISYVNDTETDEYRRERCFLECLRLERICFVSPAIRQAIIASYLA